MPSIRQNTFSDLLPDFRNLAVIARVLVAANALALIAAFYAAPNLRAALERFIEDAALLEPLLFIEVAVLFALSRLLGRLPYLAGCGAVVVLVAALAATYHGVVSSPQQMPWAAARSAFFAAMLAGALLAYFHLLVKAFSPALAEARLQALQARIRHQAAEKVGEVLERALGALRVAAHQPQHGVDAVEKEMRPDARLQRLQPRFGESR